MAPRVSRALSCFSCPNATSGFSIRVFAWARSAASKPPAAAASLLVSVAVVAGRLEWKVGWGGRERKWRLRPPPRWTPGCGADADAVGGGGGAGAAGSCSPAAPARRWPTATSGSLGTTSPGVQCAGRWAREGCPGPFVCVCVCVWLGGEGTNPPLPSPSLWAAVAFYFILIFFRGCLDFWGS